MTCWQIVLAAMEALGAILTLVGLIALFFGARSRYREARAQLDRALALGAAESADQAANPADAEEIYKKYLQLHEENGLPRPGGYGNSYQPGYESVNIMKALGDGAARDLIVAGSGVALSAAAGVLAALYPSG